LFPYLGVRFIAINDNFDSYKSDGGFIMPLTNIANEWYARDISKKVSTSIRELQKKGKYPGKNNPYGYIESKNGKSIFDIDEKTAKVVKFIFKLKYDGISSLMISRELNKMNIPSPSKYKYLKGVLKHEKYANQVWQRQTVKRIVKDIRYLGHMVYGTTKVSLYEGIKKKRVPEDEWIIVKNVNDPIISKEIFNEIQNEIENKKLKYLKKRKENSKIDILENILKGKFVCGDCKKNMRYWKKLNRKTPYAYYQCGLYVDADMRKCSSHYVLEREVILTIRKAIKKQMEILMELDKLIENNKLRLAEELILLDENIKKQNRIIKKLALQKNENYANYVEGVITKEEYLNYKKKYIFEYDLEIEKLEKIILKKSNFEKKIINRNWSKVIKRNNSKFKVNKEIVDELIDKIYYFGDKRYEIIFKFKDEYKYVIKKINDMKEENING
jgi:hypothetical protein